MCCGCEMEAEKDEQVSRAPPEPAKGAALGWRSDHMYSYWWNLWRLYVRRLFMAKKLDVSRFISDVIERRDPFNGMFQVYRGVVDYDHSLTPSILREDGPAGQEHSLIRMVMAAYPSEFISDNTALDVLVRMQHFSIPTRLLDVTLNPLVALYFATADYKDPHRKDGAVVICNVRREYIKYFDSDTVSCLSNYAKLDSEMKKDIELEAVMSGGDLCAFNESASTKRLLHLIRQEKHGFDPEINPDHIDRVYLVKPKMNNNRILAQSGAFFIFGSRKTISEPNDVVGIFDRVVIPRAAKEEIQSQLSVINVNKKSLFPDIESSAEYFKEMANNDEWLELLS